MRTLLASLLLGLLIVGPTSSVFAAEPEDGFVPIFNGKNFDGWVGNTKGYKVEEESIVCDPTAGGGNIYTEKEYANFVLRFEFKLPPGANNGLGIRAPLSGNTAYNGYELQILDDTAKKYENLKKYQYHGSLYGLAAAKRGHLNPVGEWNEQEVTVDGDLVKVVLNGTEILKVDLEEIRSNPTLDGNDHPGLKRSTGHIGFLGHGDKVEFRKLRVKSLPESK
ncbi:3-keto-disaccharide hydrolase [Bremerella alba]|uniref:3-keto-alpha-glucoside-1,2-lyase/3-keto-2-hydroxy-glucal hydratase domain-containing protein n=1 Tax=Bremerella alba TaxID=980252 RepID=A0A7V9AA51_9BACT|nr:DUF1080 domain-containing protein [Bremerella alba]MBA2117816.1 hypothetical protein [Bremerella alba]